MKVRATEKEKEVYNKRRNLTKKRKLKKEKLKRN